MPVTYKDCNHYLQLQYDNSMATFDYANRIGNVPIALKHFPDCDLVCFEGSRNLPDWYSNFKAWMIQVNGIGRVEKGFYDDTPATVADLKPRLQPGKPLVITGHSRGAGHTNVVTRELILDGYDPRMIYRVKFGEPRSGDAVYAEGFAGSPAVSLRNYGDPLDQDWVCDVPLHFMLTPYVPTEAPTMIDVPPAPDDEWGFLARHHLFLYEEATPETVCAFS